MDRNCVLDATEPAAAEPEPAQTQPESATKPEPAATEPSSTRASQPAPTETPTTEPESTATPKPELSSATEPEPVSPAASSPAASTESEPAVSPRGALPLRGPLHGSRQVGDAARRAETSGLDVVVDVVRFGGNHHRPGEQCGALLLVQLHRWVERR